MISVAIALFRAQREHKCSFGCPSLWWEIGSPCGLGVERDMTSTLPGSSGCGQDPLLDARLHWAHGATHSTSCLPTPHAAHAAQARRLAGMLACTHACLPCVCPSIPCAGEQAEHAFKPARLGNWEVPNTFERSLQAGARAGCRGSPWTTPRAAPRCSLPAPSTSKDRQRH